MDLGNVAFRLGLAAGRDDEDWVCLRNALVRGAASMRELGAEAGRLAADGHGLDLEDVELFQPILNPDKIVCVGLNYAEHVDEVRMESRDKPELFAKFPNALAGPNCYIEVPRLSKAVDYEGELAVVIGSRCRDVAVPEAET